MLYYSHVITRVGAMGSSAVCSLKVNSFNCSWTHLIQGLLLPNPLYPTKGYGRLKRPRYSGNDVCVVLDMVVYRRSPTKRPKRRKSEFFKTKNAICSHPASVVFMPGSNNLQNPRWAHDKGDFVSDWCFSRTSIRKFRTCQITATPRCTVSSGSAEWLILWCGTKCFPFHPDSTILFSR